MYRISTHLGIRKQGSVLPDRHEVSAQECVLSLHFSITKHAISMRHHPHSKLWHLAGPSSGFCRQHTVAASWGGCCCTLLLAHLGEVVLATCKEEDDVHWGQPSFNQASHAVIVACKASGWRVSWDKVEVEVAHRRRHIQETGQPTPPLPSACSRTELDRQSTVDCKA